MLAALGSVLAGCAESRPLLAAGDRAFSEHAYAQALANYDAAATTIDHDDDAIREIATKQRDTLTQLVNAEAAAARKELEAGKPQAAFVRLEAAALLALDRKRAELVREAITPVGTAIARALWPEVVAKAKPASYTAALKQASRLLRLADEKQLQEDFRRIQESALAFHRQRLTELDAAHHGARALHVGLVRMFGGKDTLDSATSSALRQRVDVGWTLGGDDCKPIAAAATKLGGSSGLPTEIELRAKCTTRSEAYVEKVKRERISYETTSRLVGESRCQSTSTYVGTETKTVREDAHSRYTETSPIYNTGQSCTTDYVQKEESRPITETYFEDEHRLRWTLVIEGTQRRRADASSAKTITLKIQVEGIDPDKAQNSLLMGTEKKRRADELASKAQEALLAELGPLFTAVRVARSAEYVTQAGTHLASGDEAAAEDAFALATFVRRSPSPEAVSFFAKRWSLDEADVKTALVDAPPSSGAVPLALPPPDGDAMREHNKRAETEALMRAAASAGMGTWQIGLATASAPNEATVFAPVVGFGGFLHGGWKGSDVFYRMPLQARGGYVTTKGLMLDAEFHAGIGYRVLGIGLQPLLGGGIAGIDTADRDKNAGVRVRLHGGFGAMLDVQVAAPVWFAVWWTRAYRLQAEGNASDPAHVDNIDARFTWVLGSPSDPTRLTIGGRYSDYDGKGSGLTGLAGYSF